MLKKKLAVTFLFLYTKRFYVNLRIKSRRNIVTDAKNLNETYFVSLSTYLILIREKKVRTFSGIRLATRTYNILMFRIIHLRSVIL